MRSGTYRERPQVAFARRCDRNHIDVGRQRFTQRYKGQPAALPPWSAMVAAGTVHMEIALVIGSNHTCCGVAGVDNLTGRHRGVGEVSVCIIVSQHLNDRVGGGAIGGHRDIRAAAGNSLDSAGVGQVGVNGVVVDRQPGCRPGTYREGPQVAFAGRCDRNHIDVGRTGVHQRCGTAGRLPPWAAMVAAEPNTWKSRLVIDSNHTRCGVTGVDYLTGGHRGYIKDPQAGAGGWSYVLR